MYKISVPISMSQINKQTLPVYLEHLRKCNADRVFLCGIGNIYMKTGLNRTAPEKIKAAITFFRDAGLEVGIWVSSIGHGSALEQSHRIENEQCYTQITGINGEAMQKYSVCPLDPFFTEDFCSGIKTLAAMGPDLIMLDDDFRLQHRKSVHFPCFCARHLSRYYEMLGTKIPRNQLEHMILTGGKNRYRTTLLQLFADTMLTFANKVREAVDAVDPSIRVGCCTCSTWDLHGTDPIQLSKAFAGSTAPFTRTFGAPYHSLNIIRAVESTRQQCAWAKGHGVEIFTEGDTYPRPRTRVPSKTLELFDLILCAEGSSNGILAYVESYNDPPDYEEGYVERFAGNTELRHAIPAFFADKTPVGVEVISMPNKAEHWMLPSETDPAAAEMIELSASGSPSRDLLASNSIPTTYGENADYPILLIGENARHLDPKKLCRGAILDIPAAQILQSRGIDAGLISCEPLTDTQEQHCTTGQIITPGSSCATYKISCHHKATIKSRYTPDNSPASYCYENASGHRFYVLAFDMFRSWLLRRNAGTSAFTDYEFNYTRQSDLISAIEWMCGKPLPAVTKKHPNLYVLASKGKKSMAVALANVHLDDVFSPEIRLDRHYSEIRFLNCTGKLDGDRVYIDHIPPYGFAAFEVK